MPPVFNLFTFLVFPSNSLRSGAARSPTTIKEMALMPCHLNDNFAQGFAQFQTAATVILVYLWFRI